LFGLKKKKAAMGIAAFGTFALLLQIILDLDARTPPRPLSETNNGKQS
jgi:hypothetical protein